MGNEESRRAYIDAKLHSQFGMNKRKRSIFTVAESVDNWFEASDLYTVSTKVSREATYCLDTRRASAIPTAANHHPAD